MVRRALPALTRRWRVLALVRDYDPSLRAGGVVQIRGDLDQPSSLGRLAGLAQAVLHSAPPPANGAGDPRTRRLLATLARRGSLPRRLVYISTTGVYGDCRGARVAKLLEEGRTFEVGVCGEIALCAMEGVEPLVACDRSGHIAAGAGAPCKAG